MINRIQILRFVLLLITAAVLSTASASDATAIKPVAPDQHSAQPHEEGKEFICSHLASTVTRFFPPPGQTGQASGHDQHESDIIHCFLDIELEPIAETIAGSNKFTVESLTDNLTSFTIDLRSNMAVDSVTMNSQPVTYTRPDHAVDVTLDKPYDKGDTFELTIAYHGSPQEVSSSFSWKTHDGTKIAATLSEPWNAHTWWPCRESLNDKFTIDIWVTVPDWMVVASNGLLQGTDTLTSSRKRYRWKESYPIITYLVSIVATNFTQWTEYYTHDAGQMPVVFYSYPESESNMRSGVADIIDQLETFSRPDIYGQYPFINEKYGIAQFEWGGGMEHQTMTSQGLFFQTLNAHELAHQWFGDMITCATWHDIWLNEGFATYSEALYKEKRPGGSFADYKSRMRNRRPGKDSGSVYVYTPDTVSKIFNGSTVYNKGSWVLHMLRHVTGDKTFFDILAAYRAAFEHSSATTEDFKNIAQTVHGQDLTWFFDQWVYGKGEPSYRFGWKSIPTGDTHKFLLHIEQYQTAYPNFKMPIDIKIASATGSKTITVWLEDDIQWYTLPTNTQVIDVQFDKDDWILIAEKQNVTYKYQTADLNQDGQVDNQDFAILASQWQTEPPNQQDLMDLANQWLQTTILN